jgi:hypothetical protein
MIDSEMSNFFLIKAAQGFPARRANASEKERRAGQKGPFMDRH